MAHPYAAPNRDRLADPHADSTRGADSDAVADSDALADADGVADEDADADPARPAGDGDRR